MRNRVVRHAHHQRSHFAGCGEALRHRCSHEQKRDFDVQQLVEGRIGDQRRQSIPPREPPVHGQGQKPALPALKLPHRGETEPDAQHVAQFVAMLNPAGLGRRIPDDMLGRARRGDGAGNGDDGLGAHLLQRLADGVGLADFFPGERGGHFAHHTAHGDFLHARAPQFLADFLHDVAERGVRFLLAEIVEGGDIGEFAHHFEMIAGSLRLFQRRVDQLVHQERQARPAVAKPVLDGFELKDMDLGRGNVAGGDRTAPPESTRLGTSL